MGEHDGIWLRLTWELDLSFQAWPVPLRLEIIRAVRCA